MKSRFSHTISLLAVLTVILVPVLASAAVTEDGPAALERPPIQIRLVGTAVADDTQKSLAVFEVDDRGQIYRREGEIVEGVLVKYILPDGVIVDTGGGEEIIKLRQAVSSGTARPEPAPPAPAVQSFGPRPPEGRNLKVVYLDRSTKQALLGTIDGDLKDVRIESVSVYGRPDGIRIFPVEPGSLFAELGLKANEVIREVDGKAVTGPDDARALLKKIRTGGEFDIKVKGRRTRQIHLIVE